MSDRIRVALIFGGQSSEHGISCLTASGVLKAIDRSRFDVVGVGISRNGRWTQVPLEVIAGYRIVDGKVPEVADPEHDAVWMVGEHGCEVATRSGEKLVDINGVDVAFALLHGPFGEDGTIQGMFELMGIKYVGSGVTASAVGMDKHFMKVAFEAAGLPVWPYVAASGHRLRHDRAAVVREINENLTYPLFVKPARGGSSLGISRVTGPDQLDAAIDEAQRFDPKIVVEQGFVGARELECRGAGRPGGPRGLPTPPASARSGSRPPTASTTSRPSTSTRTAPRWTPPRTSPRSCTARLQALAKRAYAAVDAEGLVRADFFVHGSGRVDQRGQHHARLHADLDVSHPVAGDGHDLPRAGGPPDRPGAGAPGGAALTWRVSSS